MRTPPGELGYLWFDPDPVVLVIGMLVQGPDVQALVITNGKLRWISMDLIEPDRLWATARSLKKRRRTW